MGKPEHISTIMERALKQINSDQVNRHIREIQTLSIIPTGGTIEDLETQLHKLQEATNRLLNLIGGDTCRCVDGAGYGKTGI